MPKIKSKNSLIESNIIFKNITQRKASILWLDYKGERVLYKALQNNEEITVHTFVGHPWIFRDFDSGDELVAGNGQKVYWPEAWEEGHPSHFVTINIPVYLLMDRCLQVLRKPKFKLNEDQLPSLLHSQLNQPVDNTPYTIYQGLMVDPMPDGLINHFENEQIDFVENNVYNDN